MEEFGRCYSRLCRESGAEPQETVLQRVQELPRGRLDLATQSLTVDTCRALGKLLQKEALLTELILSDCMLSEEGGPSSPGGASGPGDREPRLGCGSLALPWFARGPLPWQLWQRALPSPQTLPLRGFCSSAVGASSGVPGSRAQLLFVTEKPYLSLT